ncbi:uncharacterized protein LOC127130883 [Lathyrus oleraceus]|uniref:uncharacterized protein LOC127130883 n=1 Tax=Pisum sativum TaxID=3888 RepID=UPI0021D17DD2|nr:uncharacterized protein LOC127130883 [Pisum sativum]
MADQEQELERVSSELEDLQGNMGQVMEILQVIRAKLDTQTTVVSEVTGPTIEPQPARTVPTTWPAYGLPPGFTPPVEGAPGFVQSTQQTVPLPAINETHTVVHTFAPPLVRAHVQPYFEDQQHAPEFSNEDDERQEDIRGMKENFQILEKRLRAMEGDQVFGNATKEMCLVSGLVIPAKFKTPDFDSFQRKKEGETNAVSTSQRRSHSWKKQHKFSQKQPTYPVQYVQQPYVATVTLNFNQSQASVYQPIQQAPVYQQAPTPPAYQQPRAQAPRPQNLPNQNRIDSGIRLTLAPKSISAFLKATSSSVIGFFSAITSSMNFLYMGILLSAPNKDI